jgi:hypothetical protein
MNRIQQDKAIFAEKSLLQEEYVDKEEHQTVIRENRTHIAA